jgi:hypothetical protein
MGAVFRPKDLSNRHRKIISNDAVKDLSPDTKDYAIDIQDKAREEPPERATFDKDLGIKEKKKSIHQVTNSSNKSNADDDKN